MLRTLDHSHLFTRWLCWFTEHLVTNEDRFIGVTHHFTRFQTPGDKPVNYPVGWVRRRLTTVVSLLHAVCYELEQTDNPVFLFSESSASFQCKSCCICSRRCSDSEWTKSSVGSEEKTTDLCKRSQDQCLNQTVWKGRTECDKSSIVSVFFLPCRVPCNLDAIAGTNIRKS